MAFVSSFVQRELESDIDSDSESVENSDTFADSETQKAIWQSIQTQNKTKHDEIKMKHDYLKAIQVSNDRSNALIFCQSSDQYHTWPYN